MVQRCKFNARVRQPGESISTFCAELRSLAEHCNFEDAALENMLRDRLVCGIADRAMQQRLLSEPNLTFKKAIYDQGRIERRGHATHTNIEIFIVTKIRFYAHADVTSREVH